jgi:hypothetical protein
MPAEMFSDEYCFRARMQPAAIKPHRAITTCFSLSYFWTPEKHFYLEDLVKNA